MTLIMSEGPTRSPEVEMTEVVCRNCGYRRQMTWAVARLLPHDDAGRPCTEVCHYCLNTERGVGEADQW